MKKLLLASAVSALFAAPTTVLAQARPAAVPTLDKVLEASGISVSGYIDVAYTRADRNIEASPVPPRVFDNQNNSFGLHQLGLTIANQPRRGFGGLVNFTVGSDAQVIHSFPENNPLATPPTTTTATSMFDVTQGYLQYASGPMTLIAGKFVTLHSTEVIASTGNANISRSILFGAVPFTHTGVRGTWAVTDQVSLIAGLNNGLDQMTDANRTKTAELGVSLNPVKPLTVTVSAYLGNEPTGAGVSGTRNSLDVVASYAVTDALSLGAEALNVSQDGVPTPGGTAKLKYNGLAFYGSIMLMPKVRGAVRVEQFTDKDGLRFGAVNGKYRELTITGAYLPADNFELRAEVRKDQAKDPVFIDAATTSKTLMTVALQGLYKF